MPCATSVALNAISGGMPNAPSAITPAPSNGPIPPGAAGIMMPRFMTTIITLEAIKREEISGKRLNAERIRK